MAAVKYRLTRHLHPDHGPRDEPHFKERPVRCTCFWPLYNSWDEWEDYHAKNHGCRSSTLALEAHQTFGDGFMAFVWTA